MLSLVFEVSQTPPSLILASSTATVDNFVGNWSPATRKPRKFWLRIRLLKT
jgi:hypothetical protein